RRNPQWRLLQAHCQRIRRAGQPGGQCPGDLFHNGELRKRSARERWNAEVHRHERPGLRHDPDEGGGHGQRLDHGDHFEWSHVKPGYPANQGVLVGASRIRDAVTVPKSNTKVRRGWLVLGSVVLVSLAVAHWGCEVPPLMAPGSSISLIANPDFIVANGGVSVITAIVTEPAGTLVPDGSVVFFFTNLGRIDPQAKTVDGVARVNLVADSRSGNATVTAFASGGAAPASGGG